MVTISAKTDDFERGTQRVQAQLRQTQQVAVQAQGSFTNLGASLTRIAAPLTATVVSLAAVKTGLDSVIQSGVKMQQLTAAFTVITGSSAQAEKSLDLVRTTADKLGVSFTDLADGYKGLAAASRGTSLEGAQTAQIFTSIVTASRALQLSGEDTKGVLLAVQQIMSKGRVASEELRGQIGERLPGAFNIAARAMGVTTQELTKMLESGSILSTSFLPKFAAQLQNELGGGAQQASQGFSAAMARLGNAVQQAGAMVAQSGLLDWLAKVADRLAAIISAAPNAQRRIENLAKGQTQKDLAPLTSQNVPVAEAGQRFLTELNTMIAKEEKLAVTGNAVSIRLLERLKADRESLIKAIEAAGVKNQAFGPLLETGGSPVAGQLADFNKDLKTQIDDLNKSLAQLEERGRQSPGSRFEVIRQQIELLDKGIKQLEETLARNKDLAPLLGTGAAPSGGGLNAALLTNSKTNIAGLNAALPLIQAQAGQFGLDPALVAAIAYRESGFNPMAKSRAGAMGIMQLMPDTARGVGVRDPWNIQQNLAGGMTVLQQLFKQFNGDVSLVLAAYNAGPKRVIDAGNKIPNIAETQAYVPAVLAKYNELRGGAVPAAATTPLAQLEALRQQRQQLEVSLKAMPAVAAVKDTDIAAITQITDALLAERDALKYTREELMLQALTKARAMDSTKDFVLALQEENGEEAKRQTVRDMALDQARAIDRLDESLQEQIRSLNLSTIAQLEYRLAMANIDDALRQNILEHQKRLNVLQANETQQQRITQITTSQQEAIEQLTLTQAELLDKQLRLAGTDAETRRFAQSQQNILKGAQAAAQAADFVTNAFEQMLLTGKVSITSLAQEFGRMALSIIMDATEVKKTLGNLFIKGAGLALQALGLAGGGTSAAVTAAAAETTVPTSAGLQIAGSFASGGLVEAGKFYRVGEAGPEYFVSRTNGEIIPRAQMPNRFYQVGAANDPEGRSTSRSQGGANNRPVVVNMTVYTNDAASFKRSDGEIKSRMAGQIQQIARYA